MPTIGSIARQNDMLASVSQKFFRTDMKAADDSLLVGSVIRTSADFLKSEFGGQPALTNMVENYREEKDSFSSNFRDAMDSLQKSSDKLKDSVQTEETETGEENSAAAANPPLSTLQEFAKNNIPPQERTAVRPSDSEKNFQARFQQAREVREENQNSALTAPPAPKDNFKEFAENYLVADEEASAEEISSQNSDGRLESVQNFVRDYNSAVSYLNENRGISNRVSALANNFGSDENLTRSLSNIGIDVNSSGELSVNETALANALDEDAEGVGALLGSQGLAGQLDRSVNLANSQSENLSRRLSIMRKTTRPIQRNFSTPQKIP